MFLILGLVLGVALGLTPRAYATTPTYTQACDFSGAYVYDSQAYQCGVCCSTNSTSCTNQNSTCLATCSARTTSCANTLSTCNTNCLNTYNSCYNACSGKNKTTCRANCLTAKTTCNNNCTTAQTTCVNASYNFGSPVNTVTGVSACNTACNTANTNCQASFSTACTNFCGSLLADPSPPPPPPSIPAPPVTACSSASCCSGGWGGYTIDNFRGSNSNPVQSTTSVIRNQNKSINLSIDTTKGALTSLINNDGVPQQQSVAEQNASFGQLMPDPGIFEGGSPALFDFGRYKAAAVATGNYWSSWCAFQSSVIAGETIQKGIVYVDLWKKGTSGHTETCLDSTSLHTVTTGSLTVIGTFALGLNGFSNPTEQQNFKIALDVPIHVNPTVGPVSGSAVMDYKDIKYYQDIAKLGMFNPEGDGNAYDFAWSTIIPAATGKNPIGVDLGPNYAKFSADEDMPAIMYQDSIFDIEASINASGSIYTPGFVEVEHWVTYKNTANYIDGAIISGRGMLLGAVRADGQSCTGGTFISFNPKAIDALGVYQPSMIQKVSHTLE